MRDIGPAVTAAVAALPIDGGTIIFPSGVLTLNTPVVITTPNVMIQGAANTISRRDYGTTRLTTTANDGRTLLTFQGTGQARMLTGGVKDIVFDPNTLKNIVFLRLHFCVFFQLANCYIRFAYTALQMVFVYDSVIDKCHFRNCGRKVSDMPALLLETDTDPASNEDGCNYLFFRNCWWESNSWTCVDARNTAALSRSNGLIIFQGCKLHGVGGATVKDQPGNSAIKFAGSGLQVHSCYFHLFNNHVINLINGSGHVVSGNQFTSMGGGFNSVNIAAGITNCVVAMNDYTHGATPPAQQDWTDENFINEPAHALVRLKNNLFIQNNGGRLSASVNLIRRGPHLQIDGSQPSYALSIGSSDSYGVVIQRAAAGGTNGGTITPSALFRVSENDGLQMGGSITMGNRGGPVTPGYSGTQLSNRNHAVNTVGKTKGSLRLNTSSGALVYANGSASTDTWKDATGAVVITPS
jgi:hypothetical protein